jgi:hypothetical protein
MRAVVTGADLARKCDMFQSIKGVFVLALQIVIGMFQKDARF